MAKKKMTMRQAADAVQKAFPDRYVSVEYNIDRHVYLDGTKLEKTERRIYVENSAILFAEHGSANNGHNKIRGATWEEAARPFLDLAAWIKAGKPAPLPDPVEDEL